MLPPSFYVWLRFYSSYASYALASTRARLFSSASSCRHHTEINYREKKKSSERDRLPYCPRQSMSCTHPLSSTALLLLSECTTILPAKSIRDMPAVWSACLLCVVCVVCFCACYVAWCDGRMLCAVCAAVSSVEMGFWVCGSGGGSRSCTLLFARASCKEE